MPKGYSSYLTSKPIVQEVLTLLDSGDKSAMVNYVTKGRSKEESARYFISLQIDINKLAKRPFESAELGNIGVDWCLANGQKLAAAMMLHNIIAFFLPKFDENVFEDSIEFILDAAHRQMPIRKELAKKNADETLAWAYWDLGLAEMVANNLDASEEALKEGEKIAIALNDPKTVAWCQIFLGKLLVRRAHKMKRDGIELMRDAQYVIHKQGNEWEQEEATRIVRAARARY